MFTHSAILPALALALCLFAGPALADGPSLGTPLNEADIAAWDISIEPDGKGLPPGGGTPAQGSRIFAEKCATCHGPEGKGGVAGITAAPLPPLVGGGPITDISAAMKRIANFWPYSTTLFDYTRRSMPWPAKGGDRSRNDGLQGLNSAVTRRLNMKRPESKEK